MTSIHSQPQFGHSLSGSVGEAFARIGHKKLKALARIHGGLGKESGDVIAISRNNKRPIITVSHQQESIAEKIFNRLQQAGVITKP